MVFLRASDLCDGFTPQLFEKVARKRVAVNELVATYGGGDKAGSKKLTCAEVQRVVSSIDDAMVQTDNHVQVGIALNTGFFIDLSRVFFLF